MIRWYYAKDGQKHGPITSSELKSLATSGRLGPDDMVLQEGRPQWTKASAIKGLFATSATPLQPPMPVAAAAIPVQEASKPGFWRPLALATGGLLVLTSILSLWFFLGRASDRNQLAEVKKSVVELSSRTEKPKPNDAATRQLDELRGELADTRRSLKLVKSELAVKEGELKTLRRRRDEELAALRDQIVALQKTASVSAGETVKPKAKTGPPLSDALLDAHALGTPESVEGSVETLAKYLSAPANTTRGKARAIFRWITDRVSYNRAAIKMGNVGDNSVEGVLKHRTCVCQGYSNLFQALSRAAGVESVQIYGYAKGSSFKQTGRLGKRSLHAWNAVKLDGKWHLIDCTFGAGTTMNGEYVQKFRPEYFLASPEFLAFTHLPHEEKWQLLDNPLTKTEFLKLDKPIRYLVLQGVVELSEAVKHSQDPSFRGYVKVYRRDEGMPEYLTIPREKYLKAGQKYHFRIKSGDFSRMAINNAGESAVFTTVGETHEITYKPVKGLLRIGGLLPGSETKYGGLLEYVVE